MHLYNISTGELFSADSSLEGTGYSGGGCDPDNAELISHKNNPSSQSIVNSGPLPIGYYTIGAPVNTVTHGPYVLPLDPDTDNEMYGRDEFKIHGDSVVRPGFASDGCIIMAHDIRVKIWESGDHRLQVVS